jgi:3-dehydroquinate synthase
MAVLWVDCAFFMDFSIEHLPFNFGVYETSAHIMPELPGIEVIERDFGGNFFQPLLICDTNTEYLAVQIREKSPGGEKIPLCVLKAGESHKNWQSVEAILRCAHKVGLGRDGIFIGIGGGVISDLSAFAASIYMRGLSLALISTTLLGMVDASLGGKTGFDLFDIKNIAGTFYPARHVYMPIPSLAGLPMPEWKSGMAELIKTAILEGDSFLDDLAPLAALLFAKGAAVAMDSPLLAQCISRAVQFKGGIVAKDPLETGNRRVLLNLGHTFGHALESVAGLGTISHGEAVAWGIARSCELALALGLCPPQRMEKIKALLAACGYETAAPHPLANDGSAFMQALGSDKKKRGGTLRFIVPDAQSARIIPAASHMDTISSIINGETIF